MRFRYLFFILFLCVLLIYSCKSVKYASANANFISSINGTITMRCTAFGKVKKEVIRNAEINAINVLLFRGLPGSEQNIPLISITENQAIKEYADYFEELYDKNRYQIFIMSTIPVTDLFKDGGQKKMTIDIKINLASLRLDLERHNIIRKFGF